MKKSSAATEGMATGHAHVPAHLLANFHANSKANSKANWLANLVAHSPARLRPKGVGRVLAAVVLAGLCATGHAQVPPVAAPDQAALLKSSDPKLAANKKLVFDMWRTIIQAGQVDQAPKYFTESYIQHNPNVATGRDAMVAYMKKTRPVRPIDPTITFPVISIMAEGDLVMIATVSYTPDPEKPDQKYAGTHFDLFRIENGKIAEHWDSVAKSKAALSFNPNTDSKP